MKKQSLLLRACIVLSLLIIFVLTANSQKKLAPHLSPAEIKEFDKAQVEENALLKLSPADKAEGKEKGQAAAAYLLKAVLHRADPATYPIDDDANSLERKMLTAIDKLSAARLTKAKTKTLSIINDASKRGQLLGKFKDIDFKKKSITPEVRKINNIQLRPVVKPSDEGTAMQEQPVIIPLGVGGASGETAMPAFTKMDIVIRAIHCVDETNPETGDDDIVLGGILVGASGNVNDANTLISCHFDDGGYCNHGAYPFGTYSLRSTSYYPKTFYCVFQLVEVDTDEQEAAAAITDVMQMVAATVSAYSLPVGAIIGAVAEAMDIFSGIFFDDDAFYPYGVALGIGSANVWGPSGRSPNQRTGNISDHGGTYRIGYYWQLK